MALRRPFNRFALLLASALIAAPALAADEPASVGDAADAAPNASDGGGIGDIVVTATRKESKLQSTPVALSVIGEEIRSTQNVITTRDLAGQIPGLYTAPSGITPTTNTFFIRGIGNSDPIFDPTVGTYIDDVYLARAINGMSDLHDVERVEVLRGPQGTLFGANSGGGAIRYVTRTPTDNFEAFGDVGYGNYNTINAHGYVAGALVKGLLDASISAAHAEHDGYTWNPSQQAYVNNQNISSGRIKLLFTLAAGLKITLTGDGTIDHSQAAQYVAKAFTTINATQKQPNGLAAITAGTLYAPTAFSAFQDNVSYAGRPGVNDSLTGGLTARIDYDVDSHLSVHAISGLRAFEQAPVNYNNDGQNRVPWNAAQTNAVDISDNYINYYQHQFTQEFQLQGNWRVFDFTGGLYYLFENFSSDRIGYVTNGLPASNTALPAAPFDQIGNTRTFNYAAYLQGNVHITDRLTLTAGGRYTIARRAFAFRGVNDDLSGKPIDPALYPQVLTGGAIPALGLTIPATQINFTNANALNRKTWRSFTPKAGLSYQVTPTIFAFFNFAEGFDAGGFNNRALNIQSALPYDPENVRSYEGGLKTDWFDHRLRINATAYYNDYTNLQTQVSVFNPNFGTGAFVNTRGNAQAAHTQGFELEISGQPSSRLNLGLNVTYLDARYDNYQSPATSTLAAYNYNGVAFAGQPKWQYYASADYTVPVTGLGRIKLGVNGNWRSSYASSLLNANAPAYVYPIDATGYLNGFISFETEDGHWSATLTGRNLTNNFAHTGLTQVGVIASGTYAGTVIAQGPQNPPRTVFLKLGFKY
jgi:iron complex outermembrane receptor protein